MSTDSDRPQEQFSRRGTNTPSPQQGNREDQTVVSAKAPKFRQYSDGDWFVDIDGKRIARKSIFIARVYSEPYDPTRPFIEYKSRLEHCESCLQDAEYMDINDQCCICVHGRFENKHQENEYVKSTGFWRIPFYG